MRGRSAFTEGESLSSSVVPERDIWSSNRDDWDNKEEEDWDEVSPDPERGGEA